MKVVILAGGFGTRISEESHLKPKPMIEIGEKPILWHVMKIYSHYGYYDFIICLGYKGFYIKEYFAHYYLHEADVTFDFRDNNNMIIHNHFVEPWRVTLVNTGPETMTGGRVKRIQPYVDNATFMLTYGDGVADINIDSLLEFHRSHGKIATVSATQPTARFGMVSIDRDDKVIGFKEKPKGNGDWVNAGFFVLEPKVFGYIEGDKTVLEKEPLEYLAGDQQLVAFRHEGFWQPMDSLRDKGQLEDMWKSGRAPWKVW
jgi:glucose-1-phosphate cytidylyltransferase